MKKNKLAPGIYEQVVNERLRDELNGLEANQKELRAIDNAEAHLVLTEYLRGVIRQGLSEISGSDDEERLQGQIRLANKIVNILQEEQQHNVEEDGDEDLLSRKIAIPAEQLLSIFPAENNPHVGKKKAVMPRPTTSLIETSLFTGAKKEPPLYHEIQQEIMSAQQIDMLVSFVKWSGLSLILPQLKEFTELGGRLRIITTTYIGATDIKAVAELAKLSNTEIKVSYDTKHTRLHAKAYIFTRDTGFSTAYIGSSNLSVAAVTDGLEWNVKVTEQDAPATLAKMRGAFTSYWEASEFEVYKSDDYEKLKEALYKERYVQRDAALRKLEEWKVSHSEVLEPVKYYFSVKPYAYQQKILDTLEAEREIHHRFYNLLVAATGTGKTVISAFDYQRFCKVNARANLLFLAHREEILRQSLLCFRGVLQDENFGDLYVGQEHPEGINHLFMSIQTFNSQHWTEKTSADYYDFIVIDEFHHAEAPSYKRIFEYYQPKILLGMTATPERNDGNQNIIRKYFDSRIAAEIRLPEAIERGLLAPFHYFGVSDVVDLSKLKWTRGGYDKIELSNLYTISGVLAKRRAQVILDAVRRYVTDVAEVHGLGFCVSVAHAKFMADVFNESKISSMALSADSKPDERRSARERLAKGEIKFIFTVDLYNEGVDIPAVNTVLFLRPTESLTVFLQQLGRGLRLYEGKDCLTVLDFVGQANKRYSFDKKLEALFTHGHGGARREVQDGFTYLPPGCSIQLEKLAKQYILENLQNVFGKKNALVQKLKDYKDDGGNIELADFLRYTKMNILELYAKNTLCSFSRLCELAGLRENFCEPHEELITKALGRLAAIDSAKWLMFLLDILQDKDEMLSRDYDEEERLYLKMLVFTIWPSGPKYSNEDRTLEKLAELWQSPVMLSEVRDVLNWQLDHVDFVAPVLQVDYPCVLDIHCSYTRDQIFSSLGIDNPSSIRQGVRYIKDKKTDVFLVTLNKSEKRYSPTTMYKDYSINEWLFNWQSQSTTSDTSPTALRYFGETEKNNSIFIFVQEYKENAAGTAPYVFLGKAKHVSHKNSRPIDIIWKLEERIPGKFIEVTNKLAIV